MKTEVFRDILFRLEKGVKVKVDDSYDVTMTINNESMYLLEKYKNDELDLKPYLRSMGSMNEEEKTEYVYLFEGMPWSPNPVELLEFLIDKGFDYRGLIEDGLALES